MDHCLLGLKLDCPTHCTFHLILIFIHESPTFPVVCCCSWWDVGGRRKLCICARIVPASTQATEDEVKEEFGRSGDISDDELQLEPLEKWYILNKKVW